MNPKQYAAWAAPLLRDAPARGRRLFSDAIALSKLAGGRAGGHFIEGSFNSADGAAFLRLIHIFSLENAPAGKPASGGIVDAAGFRSFVETINGGARRPFDLRALDVVLSAKLSCGRTLNDFLGLSLDFDRRAGAFTKLTVFFNPAGPKALRELAGGLGLRAPSGLRTAGSVGRLDFIGVDLFPGGSWRLKLYARGRPAGWRLTPEQEELAGRMRSLRFERPIFKTTVSPQGDVVSCDPNWAVSGQGGGCADLAGRLGLGRYGGFLRTVEPLLADTQLKWVGLKRDKGLELYFTGGGRA